MAEGDFKFSPHEDGSDIIFDYICSPCDADGLYREAVNSCGVCDEDLCATCTKYHQRFTKSHPLSPVGAPKQLKKPTPSSFKCIHHPDRDIEVYCTAHDMVFCCLCRAKDHRSCHGVEEIKDGVHKSSVSSLQKLVDEIDNVNKEITKVKQNMSKSANLLKTKRTGILKQIDTLRIDTTNHFDGLERELKTKLDDTISEIEKEICDDIIIGGDMLTNVNDLKPVITGHLSDKDMFISEKLGKLAVSEANAFLAKSLNQVSISFKPNAHLYDCIKEADNLGKIEELGIVKQKAKPGKYVVKSTAQRNLKVESERNCNIVGMCQVPDGTIFVADYENNKLKRLDDQLDVRDVLDLKAKPYGVCTISSTKVAVRLSDSILFINVDRTLTRDKVVKVQKLSHCGGNSIALCGNHLWTNGDRCVHIYTMSGDVVKKIDTDYQPHSIAVSNDMSSVYITAGGDRVVVYNKSGDIIREVHDRLLKGTAGVCTTDDGIVFVAGSDSKNIVMHDEDGNCLDELIPETDTRMSLCYDRKHCLLIVGGGNTFYDIPLRIYKLGK